MKKILFMTAVIGSGGVEKALINMLNILVKDPNLDITVLLLKSDGVFFSQLPYSVTVRQLSLQGIDYENICRRTSLKRIVFEDVCKFRVKTAIGRVYRKIVKNDYFYYLKSIEKAKILDPELEKEYDLAVCYHMHDTFNIAYVAQKVKAMKKVAWIHNDFKTTGLRIENFKKYLKEYDEFFAVSEQLKIEFQERIPEFCNKVKVFYNILPVEKILSLVDEFYPVEYSMDEKIKILSVGRLKEQKGFDLAIKACYILKEQKHNFVWYIIGEGEQWKVLTQNILSLGLQEHIKFLGVRENPYPYIKNCDIYVQPSRHEGYATTISEAKVLCCPIVFTDVAGAREQLIDGKTGYIVSVDENEIAIAVCKLITDINLRKYFSNNLHEESKDDCDNNQLKELYKYL
jgi:glycosyltransferase involved in cell wall biosynthesis